MACLNNKALSLFIKVFCVVIGGIELLHASGVIPTPVAVGTTFLVIVIALGFFAFVRNWFLVAAAAITLLAMLIFSPILSYI